MGLFDGIAQLVEEVVETAETAAEAAVTTAQAVLDDVADAAGDAGDATAKAAEAAAKALAATLNTAARSAGHVAQQGQEILKRTEDRIEVVFGDPFGTAARGLAAMAKGMGQFGANVGNQLKQGVTSWVGDNFDNAGIPLPDNFELRNLLNFMLDVAGVTYDRLRERSGKLFGDASSGADDAGAGAVHNPLPYSRLIKVVVRGKVNGPAGQITQRIHFLLDRQSIPHVHRLAQASKANGDRTPVEISLGRRFVRNLFADHLDRLAKRSRSLTPSLTRTPRPTPSHEPIIRSVMELTQKIRAINARASDMISTSGCIVNRMKVRS